MDYEQKLFEVGKSGSSIGMATWGLGRIGKTSHRTMAARLGKEHVVTPFPNMKTVADRLCEVVEKEFTTAYPECCQIGKSLREKIARKQELSLQDQQTYQELDSLSGGYFLAGRTEDADECEGFAVEWSPIAGVQISPLPQEDVNFRGVPQIMERIIQGYDRDLAARIMASGLWNGDETSLLNILDMGELIQPTLLPIREAVDWIHTVIHTTIRAIKFAGWHVCGGPVEIATITTDRPFRWICHKNLDAAIITAQTSR